MTTYGVRGISSRRVAPGSRVSFRFAPLARDTRSRIPDERAHAKIRDPGPRQDRKGRSVRPLQSLVKSRRFAEHNPSYTRICALHPRCRTRPAALFYAALIPENIGSLTMSL